MAKLTLLTIDILVQKIIAANWWENTYLFYFMLAGKLDLDNILIFLQNHDTTRKTKDYKSNK